jgi:hypothetical protein
MASHRISRFGSSLGILCVMVTVVPSTFGAPSPRKVLPERDVPSDWKLGDLNAFFPRPEDPGPDFVLAWESITYDKESLLPPLERCLLVKKYARPGPDGDTFALAIVVRQSGEPANRKWRLTGFMPVGGPWKESVEQYKNTPSHEAVAAFLKKYFWESCVTPGEYTLVRGRAAKPGEPPRLQLKYTPERIVGGICPVAWTSAFGDRVTTAGLFPELAERK